MNNAVFGKTKENARNHREINMITTEARKNYLVSEPSYLTIKFFSEKLLAIGMKITQIRMNKTVYLALSILEMSKTGMYEFWYDCVKLKSCYMETGYFAVYIKTEEIYLETAKDVEARFDASNYVLERPLPRRKKFKKVKG